MGIWFILLIALAYGLFELINGVLFNWKLYLMSEKRFYIAGAFGAVSTLMFIFSLLFAAIIGDGGLSSTVNEIQWWIIPLVAIATGIGNFFSALLVPYFRSKIHNRKNKK